MCFVDFTWGRTAHMASLFNVAYSTRTVLAWFFCTDCVKKRQKSRPKRSCAHSSLATSHVLPSCSEWSKPDWPLRKSKAPGGSSTRVGSRIWRRFLGKESSSSSKSGWSSHWRRRRARLSSSRVTSTSTASATSCSKTVRWLTRRKLTGRGTHPIETAPSYWTTKRSKSLTMDPRESLEITVWKTNDQVYSRRTLNCSRGSSFTTCSSGTWSLGFHVRFSTQREWLKRRWERLWLLESS